MPCVAWELPSTLASLNAMMAPPKALPGPGEELSWCILYSTEHRNRNTMKSPLQVLEGPGEEASVNAMKW